MRWKELSHIICFKSPFDSRMRNKNETQDCGRKVEVEEILVGHLKLNYSYKTIVV